MRRAYNAASAEDATRNIELAVNELCKAIDELADNVKKLEARTSNLETAMHR
jgi:prefoldin subunit 5